MTARDEHYDRARQIAFSLPPSDFRSHRALEALAAVFRADATELEALRAVAEAAVPFAAHAASIDAQADAGDLPRWRDDAPVSGFTLGQCRAVLAALDRAREAGR